MKSSSVFWSALSLLVVCYSGMGMGKLQAQTEISCVTEAGKTNLYQFSPLLEKLAPQFDLDTKVELQEASTIDFPLDLPKLQQGHVMIFSKVLDPSEFAAHPLAGIDFESFHKKDDTKIIITKAAAMINNKDLAFFTPERFKNIEFLDFVNDCTHFSKSECADIKGEREVRVLGILLDTLSINVHVRDLNLADQSGSLHEDHAKAILNFNKDLEGTPAKVIKTHSTDTSMFAHGGQSVHLLYPLKDGAHSLLITYQLGAAKKSKMPYIPFVNIPRKAEEMAKAELFYFMKKIREYKGK